MVPLPLLAWFKPDGAICRRGGGGRRGALSFSFWRERERPVPSLPPSPRTNLPPPSPKPSPPPFLLQSVRPATEEGCELRRGPSPLLPKQNTDPSKWRSHRKEEEEGSREKEKRRATAKRERGEEEEVEGIPDKMVVAPAETQP